MSWSASWFPLFYSLIPNKKQVEGKGESIIAGPTCIHGNKNMGLETDEG